MGKPATSNKKKDYEDNYDDDNYDEGFDDDKGDGGGEDMLEQIRKKTQMENEKAKKFLDKKKVD